MELFNILQPLQVWEGLGVVATGRQMLGETDPVSRMCVNSLNGIVWLVRVSNIQGLNISWAQGHWLLLGLITVLFVYCGRP